MAIGLFLRELKNGLINVQTQLINTFQVCWKVKKKEESRAIRRKYRYIKVITNLK